jgi:hypothetical protein
MRALLPSLIAVAALAAAPCVAHAQLRYSNFNNSFAPGPTLNQSSFNSTLVPSTFHGSTPANAGGYGVGGIGNNGWYVGNSYMNPNGMYYNGYGYPSVYYGAYYNGFPVYGNSYSNNYARGGRQWWR